MRGIWSILAFTLLPAFCACGNNRHVEHAGGGTETPASVHLLASPEEVEAALAEGAVAFDLRAYPQWAQGHLAGARLATVEDIRRGRGLPQDTDAPILFYGDGPLDTAPEAAAEIAVEMGYDRVMLFPGGWRMWIGAHPVGEE